MLYHGLVALAQKIPASTLVALAGLTMNFSMVRSFAHEARGVNILGARVSVHCRAGRRKTLLTFGVHQKVELAKTCTAGTWELPGGNKSLVNWECVFITLFIDAFVHG